MTDNSNVKMISWLSAVAVALIALFSFAISYVAQQELAGAAGIHPWLTYVFPLIIDGFIVVASLSVLRNSLVGESSKYQWSMVGLFTVLSVAFNAAHAYDVLLGLTILGLPVTLIPHVAMPIALFFGFEMLMRQVHNAIERAGAIKRLADLNLEIEQKRSDFDAMFNDKLVELEHLNAELSNLKEEQNRLRSEIAELRRKKPIAEAFNLRKPNGDLNKANATRTVAKQQALKDLLDFYRSTPKATLAEAGRVIERSKGTVSNYLNQLEQAGVIHRNSNGVQVLEGEQADV